MQLLISKSSQHQQFYVDCEWPLGIFNRPPPSSDRRSLLISRRKRLQFGHSGVKPISVTGWMCGFSREEKPPGFSPGGKISRNGETSNGGVEALELELVNGIRTTQAAQVKLQQVWNKTMPWKNKTPMERNKTTVGRTLLRQVGRWLQMQLGIPGRQKIREKCDGHVMVKSRNTSLICT